MSKKKLPESVRVLEYFQTAPLENAQEILVLCQHAVKKRKPQAAPRPASDPKATPKARKNKQENSTGRLPSVTAADPGAPVFLDPVPIEPIPTEDLPL